MTTTEPCQEYVTLIVRAVDDQLSAAERARLDAHLAICTACRGGLADQLAVRTMLASRPPLRASAAFRTRVMSAIEGRVPWFEALDFRRWSWGLAPVAAALLLFVYTSVDRQSAVATTDAAAVESSAAASTQPVSSALWSDSVSDTSLLSLMLSASADDPLGNRLSVQKDKQP
jgi:anti-sigma factor RsiW